MPNSRARLDSRKARKALRRRNGSSGRIRAMAWAMRAADKSGLPPLIRPARCRFGAIAGERLRIRPNRARGVQGSGLLADQREQVDGRRRYAGHRADRLLSSGCDRSRPGNAPAFRGPAQPRRCRSCFRRRRGRDWARSSRRNPGATLPDAVDDHRHVAIERLVFGIAGDAASCSCSGSRPRTRRERETRTPS